MLKREVEIGREYVVKVSGKLTIVRITGESPYGGWEAVNTRTDRPVRIRTAARLRRSARSDQEVAAIMQAIRKPLADLAASFSALFFSLHARENQQVLVFNRPFPLVPLLNIDRLGQYHW